MGERTVKANGIELWSEDFGDASHPTILMVMGASAQGTAWPEELIEMVVAGQRRVIRYDNRDTGQSTHFDIAKDPYGLADLANDAVGLLDAYGIDAAHFVGASMGGMISQKVAIEHPTRIRTMTSIMSSPAGGAVARAATGDATAEDDLPPPTAELLAEMMKTVANPPKTDAERIANRVRMFQILAGSLDPAPEAELRERFTEELRRARNYEAMNNHGVAIAPEPDRRAALRSVALPTLVIHGTEDPILPYEHGVATADVIPGAELLTIEGMGHDLPRAAWPRMTSAILELTGRG